MNVMVRTGKQYDGIVAATCRHLDQRTTSGLVVSIAEHEYHRT